MVILPTYKDEETHNLNLEIAKKSKGVCFLMFSGKDSLCAWLNLRRYFNPKHIIPFHCASYPGMKHVNETLDYYEKMMDTRILRLCGEELQMGTYRLMYQTPEILTSGAYDDFEVADYSKLDILEYLRYEYNLPKAWCAVGMNIFDSIDRRIYLNKFQGKNPGNMTWYPCYTWPRKEILRAIRGSGLKLSGEYRWASRSLGGVPSATLNRIYREHYPEDYELMLSYFPLAEAKTVREALLDRIYARRRAEGIVADEPEEGEDGEFDDGSDAMPEFDRSNAGEEE